MSYVDNHTHSWGSEVVLPLNLKPRKSDLETLVKFEAQRKRRGGTLGQAAFPHPDKFLKFQIWTLLWGALEEIPWST